MQQLASQNAPSPRVVVPHFITGGIVWVLVTLLIVAFPDSFTQHFFNPQLLSITHLLVLGWLTMVVFGALYQLIPVVMEVKLYSEKLAYVSFGSLLSGTFLLAFSFWQFWLGTTMHIAAMLLLVSILLFAFNVFQSSKKSIKESIEKQFIQTSVVWLVFTVVAGVCLAINLTEVFLSPPHIELLKLHANAGMIGWFLQLIIGVSSKLIPMFMVSHKLDKSKLSIAYFLINSGLVFSIVSIYLQLHYGIVFTVIVILTGVCFFLSYLLEAYNKRLKKQLDIGMKQSVFSFIMLVVSVLVMVLLMLTTKLLAHLTLPIAIAFGATILIGFVSSLIMGQTYKTLPFIVWLHVYRNKMGKVDVPFPKDLYSEKVAQIQLASFAFGFIIFFIGILLIQEFAIQLGGVFLLFSSILYVFNSLKIVLHKSKTNE